MNELKARSTIYKGIEMRSRLEAGFAAWLDEREVKWLYEPRAFAGAGGQYLPDFRIDAVHSTYMGKTVPAYVEVKPPLDMADLEKVGQRMRIIWESEPSAMLLLASPGCNEVAVTFQPQDAGHLSNPHLAISCPLVLHLPAGWDDRWMKGMWFWGPGGALTVGTVAGTKRNSGIPHGPWPDGYWKAGL